MSNLNDTNSMTSLQVKNQLNSIHTDKTEVKNSLLNLVEQLQCLDHITKSIGLMKKGFSFVNRVSWNTVLSNLEKPDTPSEEDELKEVVETVSLSTNQLKNEVIPQLQKWRNYWMLQVILIDFLLLGLLSSVIAAVIYSQGLWEAFNFSASLQTFFYQRPVFSFLLGFGLLACFILMHFSIRTTVAKHFVRKINKEPSEFDLSGAFIRNTRLHHSIFRPDIIGWGRSTRKCLLKNKNAELN